MEGRLKDDLQDSTWIFYLINGKIGSKGNFIEGQQDGPWVFYYETGEKMERRKI